MTKRIRGVFAAGVIGFSVMAALLGTSGGVNDLEGKVGDNLEVSSRVQCVVDYCGPSDFMKFKDQATWVKVDKPDSPVCRLLGRRRIAASVPVP